MMAVKKAWPVPVRDWFLLVWKTLLPTAQGQTAPTKSYS